MKRQLKHIGITLGTLTALFLIVWAGLTNFPNGLAIGTKAQSDLSDTSLGDGDLYVADNLEVDGSAVFDGEVTFDSTLIGTGGLVNSSISLFDPATASSVAYCNIYIATATLQSSGTTWTTASGKISNIGKYSRNISCELTYQTVGLSQSTMVVVGTLRVIGYNAKGAAVDETIHIVSSATLKTMNAFSKVTSVTVKMISTSERAGVTGSPLANCEVHIGTGDKFGLPNNITSTSDVYKINEAGTEIAYDNASVDINTTYDTYKPVTVSNGSNDYELLYKAISR